MKEIKEVRDLIKDFTKKIPTDSGEMDPRYREYLAKCSRLLKLDEQLLTLSNGSKDEYFFIILKEIKEEVNKIVNSKI